MNAFAIPSTNHGPIIFQAKQQKNEVIPPLPLFFFFFILAAPAVINNSCDSHWRVNVVFVVGTMLNFHFSRESETKKKKYQQTVN